MIRSRKLNLKRDVLHELGVDELSSVAGAQSDTCFSCLAYISCYPQDCAHTRNCV